jgi:AraC-like DNA-binding protein
MLHLARPVRGATIAREKSPGGADALCATAAICDSFRGPPMMQHTMPGGLILYSVELVKRWRITPDELLAGLGLDLESLADPRTLVPVETVTALVARARALTREPAYGYYLGLQMGVTAYGLLGMAVMSAPTTREAIDLAIRFTPIVTTAISLRLEVEGSKAALILEENADFGEARESILVAALIGIWHIGLALAGLEGSGVADLALPKPAYYPEMLLVGRGRLRFDQPAHRLLFDASVLDAPYAMADPVRLQLAREQCEAILASRGPDATMKARVRSLLVRVGGRAVSLERIAQSLSTSPRTLKRQLAAEGTSFSEVLDEERHERALVLLQSPATSVKDVAHRLGFANIANFTRAFHRWTGHSPTQHRAAIASRARAR